MVIVSKSLKPILLDLSFPFFPNTHSTHRLPSTMIIWYPCAVFTSANFGFPTVLGSSSYAAFSKAASNAPRTFHPKLPPIVMPKCTKPPHQPSIAPYERMKRGGWWWWGKNWLEDFFMHAKQKSKNQKIQRERKGGGGEERLYGIPWRALSSENSRATSSNLVPERNLARASSFFECFSHYRQFLFRFQGQRALFWGRKEVDKIYRECVGCGPGYVENWWQLLVWVLKSWRSHPLRRCSCFWRPLVFCHQFWWISRCWSCFCLPLWLRFCRICTCTPYGNIICISTCFSFLFFSNCGVPGRDFGAARFLR